MAVLAVETAPTTPTTSVPGEVNVLDVLPPDERAELANTTVPLLLPRVTGWFKTAEPLVIDSGEFGYSINWADDGQGLQFEEGVFVVFDAIRIFPGSAWAAGWQERLERVPDVQTDVRGYFTVGFDVICDEADYALGPEGPMRDDTSLTWVDPAGFYYQLYPSAPPGCSQGRYTAEDLIRLADSMEPVSLA